MKDIYLKLRALMILLNEDYQYWKADVWRKDLDGYYCCNGRDCCCGGQTIREALGGKRKTKKSLTNDGIPF